MPLSMWDRYQEYLDQYCQDDEAEMMDFDTFCMEYEDFNNYD